MNEYVFRREKEDWPEGGLSEILEAWMTQTKQNSGERKGRKEEGLKEGSSKMLRGGGCRRNRILERGMEEWLQKGVQDWQKNQTLKKTRERRDLEFEY